MKKIISVLLTIVLTFGLPFTSFAENYEENPVQEVKEIYVNPLYRDVTSESDIEKQVAQIENTSKKASRRVVASSTYFTDLSEAGKYMRECMKKRQTKITINMSFPYEDDRVKSYSNLIASEAIKHTGNPVEGDYLSYQYGGWEASIGYSVSGSICNATYNYAVVYYTDVDQESEMDTKIQETIANLDIEGKSDYKKIKAVYDYICKNVTYDYKNLDVENYKLKYTAYAALCNGTSVCQGYAVLLYRMALELGIDARVISGTGITSTGGGAHAWNIIKLDDDLYYDADATWDVTYVSSNQPYRYFLKNETDFSKDHVREDDRWGYTSEEFYRDYPMADTDYKEHIWNEWKVSEEPECEKPGKKIKTCIDCGKTKTEAIAALGHEYEKSQITQKASFGQKGTIEQKCVRGDASKKTEIPAIVEPTLAEKQYKYNGTMQKPDVSVRDEKDKELPSSEYEITYDENCKDVGTHKVTITLKGDYYEGTKKLTYEIVPKSVENVSIKVDDQEYSGTEKKPEVTVKDGDTTLTKDKDYIITYKDNTNAGSASVTITGKGNYMGNKETTFKIVSETLKANMITVSGNEKYQYIGNAIKPSVTVKANGITLEQGKDYKVDYKDNIEAGIGTIIVTGIGNYAGEVQKSFEIKPRNMENVTTSNIGDHIYTGAAIMPKVEVKDGNQLLEKDKDYTISYRNNINVGTAIVVLTGINHYAGTKTVSFKIVAGNTINSGDNGNTKPDTNNQPGNNSQSGGNDSTQNSNTTVNKTVKVKKIAISGISKVAAGKKITLKATITPSNATNKKVTWKSSNTSYATVDQKGVVTTKSNAAGKSVTITATAQDGSGIKSTYNLSIYGISKITLSGISKKIATGKKITLTPAISPSDVSNKKLKWTSSNTKVATVDQKGVVTIKKKTGGKSVTITATAQDGSKKKATYKISVMKGEVTKVAVSGNKPVNAGKSLKLKAKVTASKGANKALQWTSSNVKYAKVSSSGKVTALKAGKGKSVKITAMATDGSGKKKSVTIKIK